MLVLGNGATEDQSEEKNAMMLHDAEDADDVPSRIPSGSISHGDDDESGDEAAMSSSAMSSSGVDRSTRSSKRRSTTRGGGVGGNHHRRRRGSTSPSRSTRQTSKSPSRVSPKDDADTKESTSRHKSSSGKVRQRSGRISRTRSNDEERPNSSHERKPRTTKASSSAREGKSYASNSANSRSSRGADRASHREGSKHRRRKPDNDGDKDDTAGNDSNPPTKSIPLTKETPDSRISVKKHSSSGRPRHRSKSRSRSLAKAATTNTDINGKKEESTLDSTFDTEPDPSKSLRSSVKVASALSKFRMVLAKSKQATKAAEKYHIDRDKQGKHKENLKNGTVSSSRHKRDKRESSRHKSSRHRREAKDDDGDTTEMVRKSSSRSKDSGASSGSTKKDDSPSHESPDDMLMNALSNVGRKLAKEKREKKKAQESSGGKDEAETTAKTTKAASSSVRLKSSAKVSTAMLKFQQALALSKSATRAAKNQQDTQNKLLGEVHSGTKPVATPDDYRLLKSHRNVGANSAAAVEADVSPVSTVDMVESPKSKDSPKVPTDLDEENDKDLDCGISVDGASKGDDDAVMSLSGSEVEIDSEDEMDSDIDSEFELGSVNGDGDDSVASEVHTAAEDQAGVTDSKPPVVVTPESLVGETNSVDMDSDISISDHSSVVIDSDDELDSDGEFDNDADEEDAGLDNDPEVLGDNPDAEADSEKDEKPGVLENEGAIKELLTTPQQSSWNTDAGNIFQQQNTNGAQEEGALAKALGGNEVTEISKRLKIARSLSFTSSTSGGQERSLSNWKPSSSRELDKHACPNLAIPGLSPPSKTTSLLDDSQPSPSYLPATMKHPDKADVSTAEIKINPIDLDKRSSNLTRKPSSRSLRKSKSAVGVSTKQALDDSSSGAGGRRRASRMRKPPSRSRSSTGAIVKTALEGDSQNERKSKTSSRSSHRSKSRERSSAPKRSSSASRAKLLAGVSALVKTADNKRDEVKRHSSRRKTPSRSKSHDVRPKSSRSSTATAAAGGDILLEKEASRRSRRKSNDGI